MADRRWPGRSAVGERIRLPGPGDVQAPITIVGVAANARQGDWTSPPSDEVYVALAQRSTEFGLAAMTFLLRTSGDPNAIAGSIPGAVAEVDRGVPVSRVTTMEDVVADALWRQRLTAQLTGGFALLALALAAIGIYAAVGYAVARRTREFGVRIALGGTPRQLQGLALFEGLRPVAIGAVAGIAIAIAASGFADRLLFGVRSTDPMSFSASVLLLLARRRLRRVGSGPTRESSGSDGRTAAIGSARSGLEVQDRGISRMARSAVLRRSASAPKLSAANSSAAFSCSSAHTRVLNRATAARSVSGSALAIHMGSPKRIGRPRRGQRGNRHTFSSPTFVGNSRSTSG